MILQHNFQPEVFIPWAAINEPISMLMDEKPILTTADNIRARVLHISEMHILSNDSKKLIWKLYGLSLDKFLNMWYSRTPDMHSFYFVKLNLEQIPDDNTTQSLSGEDKSGDTGCAKEV